MKLVFKYKHYDNMYSKGYTKICISYKEINEVLYHCRRGIWGFARQ